MSLTLALVLGVLLDRAFGEPARWHPLVGFGRIAARLEHNLNRGQARLLRGALGWLLLVLPPTLLIGALRTQGPGWLIDALALYVALGARALDEHAKDIARPLLNGDLNRARQQVSRIVSRDTATMDEEAVARATTESVLENGNDAIFGALFWCALAGAPGVVLYRLANTLDAMWGYRTARFNLFGRVAARTDDLLNYLPARLTALSYALLGHTRSALHCWRQQAPAWSSPNAGPVMAAGAGALGLRLGGPATYAGVVETRPPLGAGQPPRATDIARSTRLVRHSLWLWLAVCALLELSIRIATPHVA